MRLVFFIVLSIIVKTSYSQVIENRDILTLPVVIHILYKNDVQNISNEQILAQLETLNDDFAKNNENFENTPEIFKPLAANTNIKFCLANIDENGNETSGITRTETFVTEIGLTEKYFITDEGGKDAWNPEKYINIWVADFGNSGILGVTPKPGEASPIGKDGLLINYKYFGVDGLHQDENRNKGKVLTHEMGHYFGLDHIWGTLGTLCMVDDGISDTPLQNGPSFGCLEFPSPDECTQGNGIMFCNFMDYSDDECMTMFTNGQSDKMISTLQNSRSGLLNWESSYCYVANKKYEYEVNFSVFPNPAKSDINITISNGRGENAQLYDVNGKLIQEWILVSENNTFSLKNIQSGMYFLTIKNQVKKVIISH